MIRRSLIVVALATLAGATVRADTAAEAEARSARRLGLHEALEVAVRQNRTLASEAVDIVIAEAEIDQTYGLDDWLVQGNVSWNSRRTEGETTFQAAESDTVVLSGGLVRALPDGGRFGVRFDGSYNRSVIPFSIMGVESVIETESWSPALTFTFDQPLLRGFGEQTARSTRRRARAARSVQELEREGAAATVVRDVVHAYWELAYAVQDLEIRRASLALAKEQLRITQAGIDVGKLAPTEALAVEQAIAVREEEVLLSEQNVSERSLDLRRLVGLEIGPGEIDLLATDRLEVAGGVPDVDEALAKAMEQNPQLKVVRAQGEAAEIEVEVTENGLLPQLDFQASAGPTGSDADLGDAFGQMFSGSYALTAGVVFSMPLGNRGAEGAHAASQGRLRRVRVGEEDLKAQIAVQVVRAVNLVKSAQKRLEVLAKATQLAKQNIDVERARWEVGRATNFDVLKRQDELAQSELREARARADYLKALAVLESLTGELLPRYGIELAKR